MMFINRFWQFLAEVLLRVSYHLPWIMSLHYLWKHEPQQLRAFLKWCVLLHQQYIWKHAEIITWLQLNHTSLLVGYLSNSLKCYLLSNMLWMLSFFQRHSVSANNTWCMQHSSAAAVQNFISSTAVVPAAQRWTQMSTVQDLWSQYWRNQAAVGWIQANH